MAKSREDTEHTRRGRRPLTAKLRAAYNGVTAFSGGRTGSSRVSNRHSTPCLRPDGRGQGLYSVQETLLTTEYDFMSSSFQNDQNKCKYKQTNYEWSHIPQSTESSSDRSASPDGRAGDGDSEPTCGSEAVRTVLVVVGAEDDQIQQAVVRLRGAVERVPQDDRQLRVGARTCPGDHRLKNARVQVQKPRWTKSDYTRVY